MDTDAQAGSGERRRDSSAPWAILSALPEELGSLRDRCTARRRVQGLELLELDLGGRPALACVSGVGKVAAARATAILLAEGAIGGLLIVGTCGGLKRALVPGTLVHCTTAFQADLAVREGRAVESDAAWRSAWRSVAPGPEGWFLTADRPVLSPWRRIRLARAFAGDCVADMETAAAASVAARAEVPWAALRAVTDVASLFSARGFRRNYPTQAGRAADTLFALARRVAERDAVRDPGNTPPG